MERYSGYATGIMLTNYDHDIPDVLDLASLDYLHIRCGGCEQRGPNNFYKDQKVDKWSSLGAALGKPVGAFWFCSPRYWLEKGFTKDRAKLSLQNPEGDAMIEFLLGTLKNADGSWKLGKSIFWLAFDVEDSSLYTSKGTVDADWLYICTIGVMEAVDKLMAQGKVPRVNLGVYSRHYFLKDKAPTISQYLGSHPKYFLWEAYWVGQWAGPDQLISIAKMVTDFLPPKYVYYNGSPVNDKNGKPISFAPLGMATGSDSWNFWQAYGDASSAQTLKTKDVITTTGGARPICFDIFNGSKEDLLIWCGWKAPPVAEEDWKKVIGLLEEIMSFSQEAKDLIIKLRGG